MFAIDVTSAIHEAKHQNEELPHHQFMSQELEFQWQGGEKAAKLTGLNRTTLQHL